MPFIKPDYRTTSDFRGGLDVSSPSDHIADNSFQDVQNLVYISGVLQVDSGLTPFGGRVVGSPMQPFQYELSTGDRVTCLVTTTCFYVWDASAQEWLLEMPSIGTTTLTTQIEGTPWDISFSQDFGGPIGAFPPIAVASTLGMNVGDIVRIVCNNGRFFVSTITGIQGLTSITIADPMPFGYYALAGATLAFYAPLHGGPFAISWTVDPPSDALIFTNGVDPVFSYVDGVLGPLAGLSAIASTARIVTRFHGFILAIGTVEGGHALPWRVRRSSIVSATVWDPNVDATAGYDNLTDTSDAIVSVAFVGAYLILGREDSIMRCSYWGTGYATFYYEYALYNTGVIGDRGLTQTREGSVVVSSPGIYAYNGDFSLGSIGDKIFNYILSPQGNLDPAGAASLFLFYSTEYDEVWCFYPKIGSTYCNTLLRYSIKYQNWFVRTFSTQLRGAGRVYRSETTTWEELKGSWLQNAGNAWVGRSKNSPYPLILLASDTDNQVYVYDYNTSGDNGVPLQWYAISKDYPVIEEKLTFDGLIVNATGSAFFELSLDSGQTWLSLGLLTFGPNFTKQKLDYQVTGDFFRLRISGNDPTFQLADIAFRYLEASEY